jgi:hypothetical protein
MFSIKTPYNSCKSTKVVNSSSSPSFYTREMYSNNSNQLTPQTLFYQNNTYINNSPSISCISNNSKLKLTYNKYDPTITPL